MREVSLKRPFLVECYDIGGTNIRAAFIENGIKKEPFYCEKTVRGNPDLLVAQVINISSKLRGSHPDIKSDEIKVVSIGVPGPTDKMIMLGSRPLEIDSDVDFQDILGKYLRQPLILENDMNMAIHGELAMGKGKGLKNFCLLTLSTGIGIGVVINGDVYNRKTEIGHNVIEKDLLYANECQGHRGCWAAQASGSGIRQTLERNGEKEKLSTEIIFDDPKYSDFVERLRRYNAHGIGDIINAYDPEKIFIMGSLGVNQMKKIIPSKEEIAVFTIVRPIPDIEMTILGDDIGLYGAYYNALKKAGNA